MPLISIRRFLDQAKPEREEDAGLNLHASACGVLINEVDVRLLDGEGYAELRPQWSGAAALLDSLSDSGDLARFHAQVSVLLAERQRLETVREQAQGHDVRHMLGILNEALLSLVSGNEGSMDRLQRVEKWLHRTSQLNDLAAMKASLTETMRLVREESEQTRTEGAGTLQRLDAELQRARAASQRLPGLPGRSEAISALKEAAAPGVAPCLAVGCQLERLRIIRSRYGAPIADDLLMAFARSSTRLEGEQAFRWSEDSVVTLHRTAETASQKRSELEERFSQPYEYKVMTGGRAALLTVAVRWLCASPMEPGPSSVVDELEQFFEGRRWRP